MIEDLDYFHDECGIFAIWNHSDAAKLTYMGLYALQHRGQESAGIVTLDATKLDAINLQTTNPHSTNVGRHHIHKGLGLVNEVFNEKNLQHLKGQSAIGHVRYSTTGENLLSNVQPLTTNLLNGPVAIAHNGNIENSVEVRKVLQNEGSIFQGTNDTEIILHLLAKHPSNHLSTALVGALKSLIGAYSLVILAHDRLLAVRDPYGFRPLVLGKLNNQSYQDKASYVVASETCAFDLIGAEFIREIEPGEIVEISDAGLKTQFFETNQPVKKKAQCVFEHIYFARPDSVVFGRSVYESRKRFGEELAIESKIDADIVIPVPDSGVPAAIGYAQKSGIPFEFGIIRNHYVGRTFIQPGQTVRDFGVKIKLNTQPEVLRGKRVIVIDDSLVRGTTSQKIISLIRQAGAKEVHLRIAAPPTIGPCYYGVDTPQKSELIASHQSVEDIRRYIGADSLSYLSFQGLWRAVRGGPESFCSACFDGEYPTK